MLPIYCDYNIDICMCLVYLEPNDVVPQQGLEQNQPMVNHYSLDGDDPAEIASGGSTFS